MKKLLVILLFNSAFSFCEEKNSEFSERHKEEILEIIRYSEQLYKDNYKMINYKIQSEIDNLKKLEETKKKYGFKE